jgi:hypothetical protein
VDREGEHATYRAYRIAIHGLIVMAVIVMLAGDRIRWGVALLAFSGALGWARTFSLGGCSRYDLARPGSIEAAVPAVLLMSTGTSCQQLDGTRNTSREVITSVKLTVSALCFPERSQPLNRYAFRG